MPLRWPAHGESLPTDRRIRSVIPASFTPLADPSQFDTSHSPPYTTVRLPDHPTIAARAGLPAPPGIPVLPQPAADAERRARIRLAQLHLYVDNHLTDKYLAPPLAVMAAVLLTRWLPTWQAVVFGAVELAVIAGYITCYHRFRAANVTPAEERRWARRIGMAHGAHMLVWSSVVVWGWVPTDFSSLIFTMLIHLGLISLTAAMSNPHRDLLLMDMAIPFVALLLPPLFSDGAFSLGLALLGLFYSTLMLWVALKIHQTTAEATELRLRNEELIARLEHQAARDPLTGVASRSHLLATGHAEIRRASRHGHPLALLMLDIDHFKAINDSCGHLAGDRVIQAIAQACVPALRSGDCLGRLGGEEFAVVLPDTDLAAALAVAERLRETVASLQLHHEERRLALTVSIGVALLESPGEALSHLLHRADTAMYRAKAEGRNCVKAAPPSGMARPACPVGAQAVMP